MLRHINKMREQENMTTTQSHIYVENIRGFYDRRGAKKNRKHKDKSNSTQSNKLC